MPVQVHMHLARTTKRTYRFEADLENAHITVLYISQAAFPSGSPPQRIVVNVDEVE